MRRCLSILLVATTVLLPGVLRAQDAGSYRVGPEDVIEVRVTEEPKLNGRYTISKTGSIDLPPLGEIRLEGLTPEQAERRLKEVLESRVLRRATVTVKLLEYRSKPIRVLGAVKNPGPLAFSSNWTLIEAITAAGGLAANHSNLVRVLRRADNGLSDQIEIPVDDLLVEADPRVNIPLFSGDAINVPEATPVTIFLLGEFAGKGAQLFQSNERVSVLSVVARVGGLTNRASKKIVIKRQNSLGVVEETAVDYKAILGGKVPDVPLQPGDILLAKKSFL